LKGLPSILPGNFPVVLGRFRAPLMVCLLRSVLDVAALIPFSAACIGHTDSECAEEALV
jgi:hypothetical protein